ncbi:MAG: DNA mismatch repair protein MutS [Chloroflexota bacterium]
MTKPKTPPMYRQYKELKTQYPEALLFYRLGDFYELFEDDAETGSRELGLTLTKRRFSKDLSLPMAGVPHRHVDSYINRFINKGYMVAVADQLEDARKAKGLVKRGIVRVVTSGTVMDQPLLKENANNFLLAIAHKNDHYGLAYVDISTGEFTCACFVKQDVQEEIGRIQPSEVILLGKLITDTDFNHILPQLGVARISPLPEFSDGQAVLRNHFQVASLEAFSSDPLALEAAGAILHYLQVNQLSELAHITSLSTYQQAEYMALDSITRRNLELTHTLREANTQGSLLTILDQTKTRMGTRLLRRWLAHPLSNLDKIQARLDAVEMLVQDAFLRQDLRTLLHGTYDLERLAGRIGYGNANGRDLVNLKSMLVRIPEIRNLLQKTAPIPHSLLSQLLGQLNPLDGVIKTIAGSLVDEPPIHLTEGGLIKPGFDHKLDKLRDTAQESRDWLTNYEASEREKTGIKNLRIKYNQVFGFFIEVTKSNLSRVPDYYQRRSSISNGERYNTPELKAHEAKILNAEDAANELEYSLFLDVRREAAGHLPELRQTARALAQLDVLLSFAEVAAVQRYTKPDFVSDPILTLHDARHPVVEQVLEQSTPFVPNGCALNEDQRLIVLTGPNMSGKSVYLRQTALAVLMAHIGSFVAASEATIGLTDRIFVRAGASDDISQGRSTFLVEMSETAHILHHATKHSLVILDEVGRGTSTYDGMSLAWAVAEDIHQTIEARCLFATHFHEMTRLGDLLAGAANYSLAVHEKDGEVIFLRQLVPTGANRSYGIHVARLAGLPPRVLEKAADLLQSLENRNQIEALDDNVSSQTDVIDHPIVPIIAEQKTAYRIQNTSADIPVLQTPQSQIWAIIESLYQLDVANITPIDALVQLNQWQQTLKQGD